MFITDVGENVSDEPAFEDDFWVRDVLRKMILEVFGG
jgi:hypothetical protein